MCPLYHVIIEAEGKEEKRLNKSKNFTTAHSLVIRGNVCIVTKNRKIVDIPSHLSF